MGFIKAGPIGAIFGFIIGWLIDQSFDDGSNKGEYNNREYHQNHPNRQQTYGNDGIEGQRNSFLFSLLLLAAYVIRADGKVMHSEMNVVRNFLRQNFGSMAVSQGEQIILKIFDQQKKMGIYEFRVAINNSCHQIAQNMEYSERLQLVNFLVILAQADGKVVTEEINAIKEVATYLGISTLDVESMLNLKTGANDLEAAYKVLGISPNATNDEVKAAYRQMALKHHPDRVATLGDDVKQAAEKKFQEINDAKDKIYKARGM